ncbi:MAG: helix-turn-helix transcriptional regulator [Proteobacteria bacterium]|nr:helix-turn-helix transcriptional regulator [Pseudomonadota bacterium]
MTKVKETRERAEKINREIGKRLRMVRIMHGITLARLGKALGVSFQQIQKYENSTNRLSAARLAQAAAFFDVPVMIFFEGLANEGEDQERAHDTKSLRLAAELNAMPDSKAKAVLMKLIMALAEE